MIASVALGATPLWGPAHADQSPAIPRIGVLSSAPATASDEGLRDGLRELGYLEGKSIIIEWRRSLGTEEELLQQVAPGIRRIVFLMSSSNPTDARMLEEARKAAPTLGVRLMTLDARNADELDVALHAMHRNAADGLLVGSDLFLRGNKAKITQAVRKTRLPAIFPSKQYHDDGALISYGPNPSEAVRKIAVYVDKLLKGAKPSELPIEQMSKYELIIDLRVARAMGIHVPQELLLRADEVIR